MRAAGAYRYRLEWLQRTKGAPTSFGERQDTFPSQGHLWCAVEDVAGNRDTQKESERQLTTATVRARNYPAVVAGDRLVDADANTWTVKTAVEGDNEMVLEVER
ncbi:: Phage_H_T_join [Gemmata massiliana]|uniref:: Phage_H_T_join n=1 Tax=Gemmata massiliana TaxID=1210884 RepID=A0A6P2D1N7_9BACT|nr:head-tail adaptor protein [Gemmata massiliana]VTR95238.1 : Phage_H_T_join [Gemmata massiliana]